MKIVIADYCIRCGTCVDLHPDIFEYNVPEDRIDIKYDVIPEDKTEATKNAIKNCHVAAIRLQK